MSAFDDKGGLSSSPAPMADHELRQINGDFRRLREKIKGTPELLTLVSVGIGQTEEMLGLPPDNARRAAILDGFKRTAVALHRKLSPTDAHQGEELP